MLDSSDGVPDSHGQTLARKSGFTDVSLMKKKIRQHGVPNISTRILANAGGYTDIRNCLCSDNTCSGKESFYMEFSNDLICLRRNE